MIRINKNTYTSDHSTMVSVQFFYICLFRKATTLVACDSLSGYLRKFQLQASGCSTLTVAVLLGEAQRNGRGTGDTQEIEHGQLENPSA